jgi:hypothetical protein
MEHDWNIRKVSWSEHDYNRLMDIFQKNGVMPKKEGATDANR